MKDAVLAKLTQSDSTLRRRGVALVVDFLLDQPLAEVIDFDGTRSTVLAALTEKNMRRVINRHVKPGWRRYASAVEQTPEAVGSLVPEEARQSIRTAIQNSRLPKGKWAQGAVDPLLIRQLLAPVVADMLVNFAKRIPVPGAAAGAAAAASSTASVGRDVGSIAGRLTRSVQKRAEKLVDASRSVMGGLGAEMERRIQATAREFSESAVGIWRDALRDRLQSEEGRQLLGQISQQLTDHVMMTQLTDIHQDVLKQPVDAILDSVPPIVSHSVRGRFVSGIIDAELAAFVELDGGRTARDLLSEFGILERTVETTLARADGLALKLFRTPAFEQWLDELLADSK